MLTHGQLVHVLTQARAEHRAGRSASVTFPSPDLEQRLAEIGRAAEAAHLSPDVVARLMHGQCCLAEWAGRNSADDSRTPE